MQAHSRLHTEPYLVDCHCHIGLYARPAEVARQAYQRGVRIIAVTDSPSQFGKWLPYAAGLRNVDLALGLHPLSAITDHREIAKFADLSRDAIFIGEVGLDFSEAATEADRQSQTQAFGRVLQSLRGRRHFVSVHSRRADAVVLDVLEEHALTPVVMHWFSGTDRSLRRALDGGHFFSINPAMLRSPRGKRIVEAVPRDRVLLETDGPFVKVAGRPTEPSDVYDLTSDLARAWQTTPTEVRLTLARNFARGFTAGT